MVFLKKLAGWIFVIALCVYVVNNIDQVIDIIWTAVMFVVGILEKIATAIANGLDRADANTATHLLDAAIRVVTSTVGG